MRKKLLARLVAHMLSVGRYQADKARAHQRIAAQVEAAATPSEIEAVRRFLIASGSMAVPTTEISGGYDASTETTG